MCAELKHCLGLQTQLYTCRIKCTVITQHRHKPIHVQRGTASHERITNLGVSQTKLDCTFSMFTFPVCPNFEDFNSGHVGKVIKAGSKYGPRHAMH